MNTTAKTKISVFIVTLNEEEHIKEAIESVHHLDEVIVVDSGSCDRTVEIAKSLGAKVVHQDWLGFAKQKAYALSLCKNQWCFNLDGDEVIPVQAMENIQSMVDAGCCDGIRLHFEDIFMGNELSPKAKKRSIVRVFKKDSVAYPTDRLVHENVILDGNEMSVKDLVIHYGYDTAEKWMDKQNKYSSLGATQKFNKGKKANFLKLLLIFPLMLIKHFLIQGQWRSGRRGFVHAMICSMYAFLKEAKLYEHQYKQKNL